MATPVPASTADIMAEKLSCSSTTRGFCFTFEKDDREIIIVIRIIFAGEANQWFGRNFGNRNGAALSKRMLRGDDHANADAKQLLISQVVQRASLRGRNDQPELKPAIAYPVENVFDVPIVQSDVHVWHCPLKCP